MLDSLPGIWGRFFEFGVAVFSVTILSRSTQWSEAIFTPFWHCNPIRQSIFTSPLLFYTMAYFSDQIKNASTSFVIKVYEIAKQYSIMSLTRIEESVGLSPMAHEQDLLGSRDSQGKEPAPDEATKTQTFENIPSHTRSVADMKQEASGNISQSQNATNMKKNRGRKANTYGLLPNLRGSRERFC